ncbi:hypothetical protein FH972_013815 [Carpinus fangiana]|uniref:Uncharacterized protein n=1 Tax=Carpinus fangiana TaxID=176857 RepID=A0A5N6RBE4_9ROSI|nr:hypothetical protein FH972_013815 [Carpinus fangiana]
MFRSRPVTENGDVRTVQEVDDRDVPDGHFGRDGTEWHSPSRVGVSGSCPVRQGTVIRGFDFSRLIF